jgi:hypothetical protein
MISSKVLVKPSTFGPSVAISAEPFAAIPAPELKSIATSFFAFCEAIDFPLSMAVVNRSWNAFLALLALCQSSTSLPSVVVSFSPLLETRAIADNK